MEYYELNYEGIDRGDGPDGVLLDVNENMYEFALRKAMALDNAGLDFGYSKMYDGFKLVTLDGDEDGNDLHTPIDEWDDSYMVVYRHFFTFHFYVAGEKYATDIFTHMNA